MEPYCDALLAELKLLVNQVVPVYSLYFGGGTPSLLPVNMIERLMFAIRNLCSLAEDCEITLEVNPGTVTNVKLATYQKLGINRLSIGMQSAVEGELTMLNRIHRFDDVKKTFQSARDVGINNISLDLMYGLPGQSLDHWKFSLKQATDLKPDHLSLYSLTIEENTPLYVRYSAGELPEIDPDLTADMYVYAQEFLHKAGFIQYEISNWNKAGEGFPSRHNLQYWKNLPYIGIGAGAHSYWDSVRYGNVTGIQEYIDCINDAALNGEISACRAEYAKNTEYQDMQDTMMLGLRLVQDGVSRTEFFNRYGSYPESVFGKEIERCIKKGLLLFDKSDDSYKLSSRAVFIGNQVFIEFVGQ